MSARELNEHRGYWTDPEKLDAYSRALAEVIGPGDDVLDLGTGTGMLAILAARAGADKVWCYDGGGILSLARELIQANATSTEIEYVQAFTTEAELPTVDVVVCDQIGGLVHDAGVLTYFADAKARALKPGGRMVPSAFDMYLAPVESPQDYSRVDGWGSLDGFDLSAARTKAVNTEHHVDPADMALCAPGQRFATVESHDDSSIKAQCTWTASRTATLHGLVGWFDATMSPSVRLTNEPHHPQRMQRWVNFYPVENPIEVADGDEISATIDIRPTGNIVSWSVTHDGHRQTHSTFLGQLISLDQFRGADDHDPAKTLAKRELIRAIIEALDHQASSTELLALANGTGLFASVEISTRFVRDIVVATGATWSHSEN